MIPGSGPNAYAPSQPQAGPSKPPALSSAVLKQQVIIFFRILLCLSSHCTTSLMP